MKFENLNSLETLEIKASPAVVSIAGILVTSSAAALKDDDGPPEPEPASTGSGRQRPDRLSCASAFRPGWARTVIRPDDGPRVSLPRPHPPSTLLGARRTGATPWSGGLYLIVRVIHSFAASNS